jgi:hypothetical protein
MTGVVVMSPFIYIHLNYQKEIITMKQTDVTIIQDLVMQVNISTSKRAIEIGTHLFKLKHSLIHGEWIPFVKQNIGLSIRTCQNYMGLAKQVIHEKHYHLGLEGLMAAIREGQDLSK